MLVFSTIIQSRPQPTQTTTERPKEPAYSSTALALMNIPDPMIQARSRLIASRRPMVGGCVIGLLDRDGTADA